VRTYLDGGLSWWLLHVGRDSEEVGTVLIEELGTVLLEELERLFLEQFVIAGVHG
jgi:3-keto-L-gulonate-6-phosphate decarboxylase